MTSFDHSNEDTPLQQGRETTGKEPGSARGREAARGREFTYPGAGLSHEGDRSLSVIGTAA